MNPMCFRIAAAYVLGRGDEKKPKVSRSELRRMKRAFYYLSKVAHACGIAEALKQGKAPPGYTIEDYVKLCHTAGLRVKFELIPNENQNHPTKVQSTKGKLVRHVQAVEARVGAKAHHRRSAKGARRGPAVERSHLKAYYREFPKTGPVPTAAMVEDFKKRHGK